uniref:Uncharacterized protein n=1 Tax=Rhizophora mucronata TaxID=61149 RepID=A0A2P2IQ69_RHIMU
MEPNWLIYASIAVPWIL